MVFVKSAIIILYTFHKNKKNEKKGLQKVFFRVILYMVDESAANLEN